MILIQQRTTVDCGVACLAMVAAREYDDVLTTIGDAFDPDVGLVSTQRAVARLGFFSTFEEGEPVGDVVHLRRDWCISTAMFRRLMWGRRALATVPSLNFPKVQHMIYFDGQTVFDPSLLRTYTKLVDLEPNELVLFREAP